MACLSDQIAKRVDRSIANEEIPKGAYQSQKLEVQNFSKSKFHISRVTFSSMPLLSCIKKSRILSSTKKLSKSKIVSACKRFVRSSRNGSPNWPSPTVISKWLKIWSQNMTRKLVGVMIFKVILAPKSIFSLIFSIKNRYLT